MALKWALTSAYNIVLGGHVTDTNNPKIKFPDGKTQQQQQQQKEMISHGHGLLNNGKTNLVNQKCISGFQMPLHYPRYKKADYEKMEDWKLDMLLQEYGLNFNGNLKEKRKFVMGAFLWPDQL